LPSLNKLEISVRQEIGVGKLFYIGATKTMTTVNSVDPTSIVRVDVENLFGKYTYSLSIDKKGADRHSTLLIMYGDNGCGKTTVLKLLFHLLSPNIRRGHRTFLARAPFANFSVYLADGTRISARREDGNIVGSFQFFIMRKDKIIATTIMSTMKKKIMSKVKMKLSLNI
jgi:predicted ATP-binding protein involved in virulence